MLENFAIIIKIKFIKTIAKYLMLSYNIFMGIYREKRKNMSKFIYRSMRNVGKTTQNLYVCQK